MGGPVTLNPPRFFGDRLVADQFLYVVSDFVSQDVGAGELSGRMQLALHVAEEQEIDVDAFVARAIERSHGGAGQPAGRVDPAAEKMQRRMAIITAHFPE